MKNKTILNQSQADISGATQRARENASKFSEAFAMANELHRDIQLRSGKDLTDLIFLGAAQFFKERLLDKFREAQPVFAGMPVPPEKALEMVQLPDYAPLQRLLANLAPVADALNDVSFDGKAFRVDDDAVQRITDRYTQYCENSAQETFIAAYKRAAEALQAFNDAAGKAGALSLYEGSELRRYFRVNDRGEVSINPSHVGACIVGMRAKEN